jgi:hypothetical protein
MYLMKNKIGKMFCVNRILGNGKFVEFRELWCLWSLESFEYQRIETFLITQIILTLTHSLTPHN